MEKETENVEGDRDSPLAKTQRLSDMSPPATISESQNVNERNLEHEIVEQSDLNVLKPLVASPSDLSNSQLDGQADHEEEEPGQNDSDENPKIHVAAPISPTTIVDKTQAEEKFVEVEKSKSSPVETSSNYHNMHSGDFNDNNVEFRYSGGLNT